MAMAASTQDLLDTGECSPFVCSLESELSTGFESVPRTQASSTSRSLTDPEDAGNWTGESSEYRTGRSEQAVSSSITQRTAPRSRNLMHTGNQSDEEDGDDVTGGRRLGGGSSSYLDGDSDTDSDDSYNLRASTSCWAKRRCCYRCAPVDILNAVSQVLVFISSACTSVLCLITKIVCQDQCLLDATYHADGNHKLSTSKTRCELVLYSTLTSLGLPVLFSCVTWVAQFSEHRRWLTLQTLMTFAALLGMSLITYLQYRMTADWCFNLQKNMVPEEQQQQGEKNLTCMNALTIWDKANNINRLDKLYRYSWDTLYMLLVVVGTWAIAAVVIVGKKYSLHGYLRQRDLKRNKLPVGHRRDEGWRRGARADADGTGHENDGNDGVNIGRNNGGNMATGNSEDTGNTGEGNATGNTHNNRNGNRMYSSNEASDGREDNALLCEDEDGGGYDNDISYDDDDDTVDMEAVDNDGNSGDNRRDGNRADNTGDNTGRPDTTDNITQEQHTDGDREADQRVTV